MATYTATNSMGPTTGWLIGVEPGGGDGDFFDIDNNGVLTFETPPDYESPKDTGGNNRYSFSIMAYDTNPPNGQRPGQAYFSVTVIVTDVDDALVSGPSAVDYPENSDRPVGHYTVTAPEGTNVTVSLSGDDRGDFSWNNGVLSFRTSPDHEAPADDDGDNVYHVTIEASDGELTNSLDVAVTVTDVNEAPVVTGDTSVNYPENGTSTVATYTAADPENDGFTWSLAGDDSADFFISNTGVLIFNTPPNFEEPADADRNNEYRVIVQASDGNETGTWAVTINVTNVNEPPTFPTRSVTRSVAENTPPNRSIGDKVTATDPDAGYVLTYTLSGDDADSFNIVETSGELQTKAPLDREDRFTYTVTVSVSDGLDANGNDDTTADDTITATITVTDVNEAPVITAVDSVVTGDSSINYPENGSGPVATYTAEDPEEATVTWSLGGDDAGDFSIGRDTGVLTFQTPPNYEAPADDSEDNEYVVTVQASDGTKTGTLSVTVTVTDVNEEPEFPNTENGERSVDEKTQAGQDIGAPIAATDPDAGATLTYTMTGDDSASFDIDQSSGQLRTKDDLDYESKSSYHFTVLVSDGRDANGDADTTADDTITVYIDVTDVNEAPVATGDSSVNYPENGSGTVATYDADDPENNQITWSLRGEDSDDFYISSSGALNFNTTPNYEAAADHNADNVYVVTVRASDGTKTSTMDVTITVTDVNEMPEFPSPETRDRSVAENTRSGEDIGAPFEATDPDTRDTLIYTLSGDDAESFDIDPSSGQLRTKEDLDYESNSSYIVTVSVSDGRDDNGDDDTAADDTITVYIDVTDVNEAPEFDTETDTRTVAENTRAGQTIGDRFEATDPDSDYPLIYTLDGDDAASFDIDERSGWLRTKDDLDYETKDSYSVTVSVRDNKDADGNVDAMTDNTISVTVTITNVDEDGAVALSSLQPQVDTPLTATVTDPDGGVSIVSWKWESSSDRSAWAAISGATSGTYTPVAGDVNNYLRVTASYTDGEDSGKSAQAESDSPVKAAPITNSAPEFPSTETGTRDVDENTGPGENIGDSVEATDVDTGDTLTYTLGGADADSFGIVPSLGQLQTKAPLDYETGRTSYTVTVTATDSSNESDTITVTINVTDVNEAPVVVGQVIGYNENGTGPVATYAATDPEGHEITWELSGIDSGVFSINGGEIAFDSPPDFEAPADADRNNAYELTIEASDDDDNTGEVEITVTVTNVDEAPIITGDATREYAENGAGPVATYTAADPEGKTITWSLKRYDSDKFSISDNGELTFKSPPNYEERADTNRDNVYDLNIEASDGTRTDTLSVSITVTDVNETPVVTGESSVDYAENGTGTVATYTATDPENNQIEWSLGGDDSDDFSISTTGELTFKSPPNYETNNEYVVMVQAFDGVTTGDAQVTITVTNVNEAPEFATETDTRTVEENTGAVQNIGAPIEATDPEGDTLTYTLGGADAASFAIVPSSGQLQTKAPLDHETKDSYTVTVTATDPSNASETITVTINVTNVEETPKVVGQVIPYAENGTGPVATYKANDPENDEITWSLGGDDRAYFSISTGGELTFITPPDFESPADADTNNVYELTIEAFDNINTGDLGVRVTVTNVNEKPEFPDTETGQRSVPENTDAENDIGDPVKATDPEDNSALYYALDGTHKDLFTIHITTGRLWTLAPLDYEALAQDFTYSLEVWVSDCKDDNDEPQSGCGESGVSHSARDAKIDVNVQVTDINEAPTFPYESYTRAIPENPAGGEDLGDPITADDPEGQDLTYTLGGADAGSFDIATTTGQLLTKAGQDYEAKNSYTVTVKASDGTNSSDEVEVTLTVNGVNRGVKRPPDGGNNNPGGNGGGNSGGGGGGGGSGSSSSRNNREPAFPSTIDYDRSVAENTAAGTNIGQPFKARDRDGDPLIYSLGGTDRESFDIVASSGQLQTKAPLDYETKNIYTMTVSVSDSKNKKDLLDETIDDTIVVTINVTDVDDGPASSGDATTEDGIAPVVTGQSSVDYEENGSGTVATYAATTNPAGGDVTWSLAGDDAGDFSISNTGSNSGVLTFRASPDHEAPADANEDNEYLVTVQATDGTKTGALAVTVTVTNVDEAPVVTGKSSVDYAENGTGNVATYTATDPENGQITWSLSGDDGNDFSISNTGALTFKASPDHEAPTDDNEDNQYVVTVQAADGTKTGALAVTVTVTDVDEEVGGSDTPNGNGGPGDGGGVGTRGDGSGSDGSPTLEVNRAPAFTEGAQAERSVAEDAAAGANIGQPVTAEDADEDTLTYTLGGFDAGSFTIVASTGQLQAKAPLDYEVKSSYFVTVSVSDSKNVAGNADMRADDTITVTINVTNVDEAGKIAVSSVQPQANTPLTVALSDPEGGISDVTWLWEKSSDGVTWTTIQGATSAFYEPGADEVGSYLRVTATYTDGNGAAKTVQVATANPVRAEPATNSAPEFATDTDTRSIAENTPAGEDVGGPVTAADADNDVLTYSLGGDDAESFDIAASSGQLRTKAPLDYEDQSAYTVTVTAADPSNASDTITVTITVTDEAEAPVVLGTVATDLITNGPGMSPLSPEGEPITSPPGGGLGVFPVSTGVFPVNTMGELTFSAPQLDSDATVSPRADNTRGGMFWARLIAVSMMALGALLMGAGIYITLYQDMPRRRARLQGLPYHPLPSLPKPADIQVPAEREGARPAHIGAPSPSAPAPRGGEKTPARLVSLAMLVVGVSLVAVGVYITIGIF